MSGARAAGPRRPRGVPRRTTALAAFAALGVAALAACGVRTTSVPVDAGAAPSRLPCEVGQDGSDHQIDQNGHTGRTEPGSEVPGSSPRGQPVRIYLVCASELSAVERAVPAPTVARVKLAQILLDDLQARPTADEHQAGFTTYVERPLFVTDGRHGDPAGTLRLSMQPENLPQAALAQIVCTFADNGVGGRGDGMMQGNTTGPVLLGGPGAYTPQAYTCAPGVKADPDAPVPTTAPGPGTHS